MKNTSRVVTLAGFAVMAAVLLSMICVSVSATQCPAGSQFCPLSVQEKSSPVTSTVCGDTQKGMVLSGYAKAPIPRVSSQQIATLISQYNSGTHTVPTFTIPRMQTPDLGSYGVHYYWAPCR